MVTKKAHRKNVSGIRKESQERKGCAQARGLFHDLGFFILNVMG